MVKCFFNNFSSYLFEDDCHQIRCRLPGGQTMFNRDFISYAFKKIHIINQLDCLQNNSSLVTNKVNLRKFHYLRKLLHLTYLVISSLYFPNVHSIFFHFRKKSTKLALVSRPQGLCHYHYFKKIEFTCLKLILFQLYFCLIHVDSKYYLFEYHSFNNQMTLQSFLEFSCLSMKSHALKQSKKHFLDFVSLSSLNLIQLF